MYIIGSPNTHIATTSTNPNVSGEYANQKIDVLLIYTIMSADKNSELNTIFTGCEAERHLIVTARYL